MALADTAPPSLQKFLARLELPEVLTGLGLLEETKDVVVPTVGPTEVTDGGLPSSDDMLGRLGVSRAGAIVVVLVVIVVVSTISLIAGRAMAKRNTASGKILALASAEYKLLIPATFCLYANSAIMAIIPFYGGQFVQLIGQGAHATASHLNQITLILVVIAFATAFTSLCRGTLFTLAGERIIQKLRNRVYEALLKQEIAFFDENTSGALISRLASDTGTLQSAASVNISMFLRTLASMILSLMIMFATSWKLTFTMLAIVPPMVFLAFVMGKWSKKSSREYQEQVAVSSEVAADTFGNVRTVRAFFYGQEMLKAKYHAASARIYRYGFIKSWIYGLWSGVVFFLFFTGFALVLRFGAGLVLRGEMAQGDLISFVLYTINMAGSLGVLGSVLPAFASAIGATMKIFEIIDRTPKMTEGSNHPEKCFGIIAFDDVTFAYPTRSDVDVLKGVSWTASTSGVTALVGQSGSGKSSCISLIQRLYDVTSGVVKIDGYDIRELKYLFLRRNIAIVSQEPILFSVSVEENILFGVSEDRHSKDVQERMLEAAKLANCHAFIDDFPDKYATLVGEKGTQLSGGQKQRVAIARAVIMQPTILLLDEATSALDAESEGIVQDALNKLLEMKGRTFVVVAHRLSTVKNSDLIIVMEKGLILESGTHHELLAKGSTYKDLVQRQIEHAEKD
mmetsp:Transcript_17775/g.41405  ORF Transcript_17775/g.41405 Transcript_17775/m.41405 type:complete len:681 (+) Transcript_17775:101-2143(+)|eukprot:CAMPEP_0178438538 /NCGR_PEP_ID=MMETSP0689_2-20121128/35646_1 /TAXON_ID=160604 /ORGANISM="Amphidinium massartii, Strain CS-259" /LENGTH=680 /DNA_ID=CAMNT_0020060947 /DNA_START=21 /DNA_END=2063 /DNA_ORIENTATION=-